MTEDPHRLRLSLLTLFRPASGSASRRDEDILREEVGQDLAQLFATTDLAAALDLSAHPHVARSVLNYGIPEMSRLTISDQGLARAQKDLHQALIRHEPRIAPASVRIQPRDGDPPETDGRQHLAFDIAADLRVEPVEMAISFAARIDLAASRVAAVDLKVTGVRPI